MANVNKTDQHLSDLLNRKLLVLIGKGGVGKTTLCAGLGLHAARTGKRVLLAEVRAPKRIPPLFEKTTDSDGPTPLGDNITWINLTAQAAIEVYAMRLLRLRTVYRAVFEQRAVKRFLGLVPSLNETLILGHLTHILESEQYDLVILDAPSTGPGALMLEVPQAIIETAPAGPLRDGASWIQKLLTDPLKTAVNIVVLLEELPVSESIALFHRLRDSIGIPLGYSFANRVMDNPYPDGYGSIVSLMERDPRFQNLLDSCSLFLSRLSLQQTYLDRLKAGVDLPVICFPEIIERPFGAKAIARLADTFAGSFGEIS